MKNINWQTMGYVALGIFMLICYAYVDGKEISKKIIPDYKLVNDNGYFEILNDDGEMSIFCISKSVRGNAKDTPRAWDAMPIRPPSRVAIASWKPLPRTPSIRSFGMRQSSKIIN